MESGCEMKIDMDISASYLPNVKLHLWGSEFPPCYITDVFVNYGCEVSTQCSDDTYNPECIETIIIENEDISNPGNVNLMPISSIPWINNTGVPINYIILVPERNVNQARVYIDNIVIQKECSYAEFEYEIICNEASFTSNIQNPINTHLWDFGDGQTSTQTNPIHIYSESGVYTVTHTVITECETLIETQDITIVDCIDENCECNNGTNIPNGVTNINVN